MVEGLNNGTARKHSLEQLMEVCKQLVTLYYVYWHRNVCSGILFDTADLQQQLAVASIVAGIDTTATARCAGVSGEKRHPAVVPHSHWGKPACG